MLEDEFGDIIKKARNGLNISLKSLEEKTKIKEKDLSLMEAYKSKPNNEQIEKLSKVLKLNSEKLKNIVNGWEPKKKVLKDKDVEVERIENDYYGYNVNSYLIIKGKEALAVDTGAHPETITYKAKERNVELKALLITHGHTDHAGGKEEFGCKIIEDINDKELKIGNFKVKAIRISGHTATSNSFLINKFLFVGDELFAGSIGGSHIPYEKHLENIKNKIFSLDEKVIILPGHGPMTSVKEEKENNPFYS